MYECMYVCTVAILVQGLHSIGLDLDHLVTFVAFWELVLPFGWGPGPVHIKCILKPNLTHHSPSVHHCPHNLVFALFAVAFRAWLWLLDNCWKTQKNGKYVSAMETL